MFNFDGRNYNSKTVLGFDPQVEPMSKDRAQLLREAGDVTVWVQVWSDMRGMLHENCRCSLDAIPCELIHVVADESVQQTVADWLYQTKRRPVMMLEQDDVELSIVGPEDYDKLAFGRPLR